jgi:hypothetical protein
MATLAIEERSATRMDDVQLTLCDHFNSDNSVNTTRRHSEVACLQQCRNQILFGIFLGLL